MSGSGRTARPRDTARGVGGLATLAAWPSRRRFLVDSSFRSSRGCRGSAPSTRSRSRRGPAELAKRSIKKESKLQALELAVRMMDLTTLEGADTPGKVAALCSKAVRPDPVDRSIPSVAAVCVYPNLVAMASERLRGTGVKVASVATAFPSGQSPTALKVAEVREVVELGADEVDMVIDRGAFLSGRYAKVYDEIRQVKEACRAGPPEGDPRDGRARHLRQRPPRVAARDGRRCRLHQDLDRQGDRRPRPCP